jgi:hypothetical protein
MGQKLEALSVKTSIVYVIGFCNGDNDSCGYELKPKK